jgi:hypothetical protein
MRFMLGLLAIIGVGLFLGLISAMAGKWFCDCSARRDRVRSQAEISTVSKVPCRHQTK